jgi:hypothetical protein
MPQMNGLTLAGLFVKQRPSSAVLLMSGTTDLGIPELPLLTKPFSAEVLLLRVRHLLK